MANPRCFFDIAIGGNAAGRVVFELFSSRLPKTTTNFLELCKGFNYSGKTLTYKGSSFHRIIPQFMCQGGDFTRGNGTGGMSIYGEKFADEGFFYTHDKPYLLSMANAGPQHQRQPVLHHHRRLPLARQQARRFWPSRDRQRDHRRHGGRRLPFWYHLQASHHH
eukprot:TRINITY_DN810_c0_g1_i1.p2 TRINITY_DN810_c0_g1~~TRINITY_DN810_c0_g1_i1.p2  ORF type:complete len:164 (-),score=50.58 TRINITY_DN810_c0_g1_i1:83-574(-)